MAQDMQGIRLKTILNRFFVSRNQPYDLPPPGGCPVFTEYYTRQKGGRRKRPKKNPRFSSS